jgi:hypothetical protein
LNLYLLLFLANLASFGLPSWIHTGLVLRILTKTWTSFLEGSPNRLDASTPEFWVLGQGQAPGFMAKLPFFTKDIKTA